jgi:hypothetical protein
MRAKEKLTTTSSPPVKESERLSILIAETTDLLAATQTALLHLPARHTALLGEAEVDLGQVAQVKEDTVSLDLDVTDLTTRLRLLEQQKWAAEKVEAQARLADITTEAAGLVTTARTALTVLDECQAALIAALTTVVDVHVRHAQLIKERNWLTSSYRLPRSELPRLTEFAGMPELTVKVGEVCELLHQEQLRPPVPRKRRPVTESVFEEA